MPTLKTVLEGVLANLLQPGIDKSKFDNGSWFAAVKGYLLRAVLEVDPGTAEAQREPFFEDQRMGPLDSLNNRAEANTRVRIDLGTAQRAVMEAVYGKQGLFLSKTAANVANVVGDPSKAAGPEALARADVGHLILVKVVKDSGGLEYSLDMPRQLYPDIDTTAAARYRFSSYTGGYFEDIESSGQGGTLTWGTNRYMGECSIGGIVFRAGAVLTYDSSQQYSATLTDGIKIAEIPEWAEGDYEISDGDLVVILNCCYFYMQFSALADTGSFQMGTPFASFERVPLELFRTLGDAAGGKSKNMIRRVYWRAILSAPLTEPTRGDDGTVTKRSAEYMIYPDNSEFGDGSYFAEQQFLWV